uniref:Integrase catalytic domain-containing protein n=1 Tax=Caenorhabditis japonica TaxID=281687 RepID=A0A8R1IS82_CAEJA
MREHDLTYLIVRDIHRENAHLPASYMAGAVYRKYWILKVGKIIQKVTQLCYKCKKQSGQPFQYQYSKNLPECRTTPATPFRHVGLDYFGPIRYTNVLNKNGTIRSVLIKCKKQLLKRSVKHLIPLEIDETEQEEKIREDTDNTQTEQNDTRKPENYELTKESEEILNESENQTKKTGDLEYETRKRLPRKAKKPINYDKMNRGFSVAGGSVAE